MGVLVILHPLLTRIICSQLIYYIMARPYIYFCTSDIVEERKTYIFISHFQCAGLMVLRCLRGISTRYPVKRGHNSVSMKYTLTPLYTFSDLHNNR